MITHVVVMGAGTLVGVLASKPGRKELYGLLRDREIPIPIPGVSGLTLQLKKGREHRAGEDGVKNAKPIHKVVG